MTTQCSRHWKKPRMHSFVNEYNDKLQFIHVLTHQSLRWPSLLSSKILRISVFRSCCIYALSRALISGPAREPWQAVIFGCWWTGCSLLQSTQCTWIRKLFWYALLGYVHQQTYDMFPHAVLQAKVGLTLIGFFFAFASSHFSWRDSWKALKASW